MLKIFGLILVIVGAISVYGSKFYFKKFDAQFDIVNNADYSYKKLAFVKIIGLVVTLIGIGIILISGGKL